AGIVTSRREGRNIYYRLTNLAILDLIHQAAVIRGGREYVLPTTGPLNLYGECPCPNCEAEYLVLHKDGQAGNTSERI
ncbi:MAG: hypothetical protein ACWGOY_15495, partial [Anaerolineales bacterium]